MREIIEYKISCLSQIPQDLADGWQPLGGPIMVAQRIHQAMVKYAKVVVIPKAKARKLSKA